MPSGVVPVRTGLLPEDSSVSSRHTPLHTHHISVCAANIVAYSFAMYGFNSGHFVGVSTALPVQVAVTANMRPCGRVMFKKYTSCSGICDSASSLLQSVASSKAKITIHCYCIHAHRFLKQETEKAFWSTQIVIIKQLRLSRGLISLFVYVHTSCDMAMVRSFRKSIERTGWHVTTTDIYYPDVGGSLADSGTFLVGFHSLILKIQTTITSSTLEVRSLSLDSRVLNHTFQQHAK